MKRRTVEKELASPKTELEVIETSWKVENVVATATVGINGDDKIDLNQVARRHPDCEYNPERFPGLVMRIKDPTATALVFSTGKMVITGLREEGHADAALSLIMKRLSKAGIKMKPDPEITVQNIVASGELKRGDKSLPIDLNEASIVMENSVYEPEVFPGLIHRMVEPKSCFLIFSTGRFVCTGTKTAEKAGDAIKKLANEIGDLGVFYEGNGYIEGADSAIF